MRHALSNDSGSDNAKPPAAARHPIRAILDRMPVRRSVLAARASLLALALVGGQPVTAQSYPDGRWAAPAYAPQAAPAYAPTLSYGRDVTTPPPNRRASYSDAPAIGSPPSMHIRRDPSGSFVANVLMNGVPVRVIIDTGAQCTILSLRDARQTGADRDITNSETMAGIGGYTQLNVTRVRSMNVGGQQLGGFSAVIGQAGIPYTLLGQSEISKLGRIVIEDGVMTISAR